MSQRQIALVLLIVIDGVLLLALGIAGQWWALAMFGAITVVVLLAELGAHLTTGKTISRHFWKFKKEHPVWAWVIALLPVLALSALAWHLLA